MNAISIASTSPVFGRKGTAGEPVRMLSWIHQFFDTTGSEGTPHRLVTVVQGSAVLAKAPAAVDPAVRNFNQIIQHAQFVLGLTRKDLAKVFDVSRQTLYSRLKDDDASTPHNADRFHAINRVVTAIEQATTVAFGASAKTLNVENTTLFAELCAQPLNQDHIVHLAQIIDVTLREQSEKLAGISEKQLKDNLTRLAPSA